LAGNADQNFQKPSLLNGSFSVWPLPFVVQKTTG